MEIDILRNQSLTEWFERIRKKETRICTLGSGSVGDSNLLFAEQYLQSQLPLPPLLLYSRCDCKDKPYEMAYYTHFYHNAYALWEKYYINDGGASSRAKVPFWIGSALMDVAFVYVNSANRSDIHAELAYLLRWAIVGTRQE